MNVRLPKGDNRTVVVGSTGSGKTQFAVWLLSQRASLTIPVYIFDYKGDILIERLEDEGVAQEISIFGAPPKKGGIYILRPIPELHDKAVEAFLWACWERGRCLIYIDEGYMFDPRNPALNACLTQGRSKRIEMIILSQRPRFMSKFVFSEASFYALFNLTHIDDRKYLSTWVGKKELTILPKYYCLWYDIENQNEATFAPVPDADTIIASFVTKFSRKAKAI